ncbi:hypothetical protein [Lapillicoccus jejuensis]|uniref:Uncharacterized protein n=1 Tax=Lapillicoccus jejuensis TaxID=402171 RepID=A0A542E0V2_9MICO|nr:hypothetical protein [Lapillicoccus jejuensis]TQJ08967.1 hypothetical protein FB458_2068 [Lapillicoccus jejuensis]
MHEHHHHRHPGRPGGPFGFGPGSGPGFGPGGGPRGPEGEGPGGPGGPRGRRRGGPFGRPGGWQQADLPSADDAAAWFAGRLPDGWFTGRPTVSVDREEIIVVGELPPVDAAEGESATATAQGRISRFREDTRDERVAIAREAEQRYGRKVGWGARIGDVTEVFTTQSVPVMTRLRQPQRQVLDTLVDAGVARSRSEALAWAVALVGQHTEEWLSGLREAMAEVDKLRAEGPQV